MGDPERYRGSDEVKKWQETDPIGIYHQYLINEKIANKKELDEIEAKVEQEVREAVQFAEASPEPALDSLFEHIYVEP
jgi:pyruvate dehydrogenase E1 component alpha subunit